MICFSTIAIRMVKSDKKISQREMHRLIKFGIVFLPDHLPENGPDGSPAINP